MKLLLFISCCFIFSASSHDIQVAYFKISEDQDTLRIDFVFEKEDLLETLDKQQGEVSKEQLQIYLREHFSLLINDKKEDIVLGDMRTEEKHLFMRGVLAHLNQKITSLEVHNTCLLNIDDHSNIIEIRLHDQERDFLMNSDRNNIKVIF